jgi:hypothetical protein
MMEKSHGISRAKTTYRNTGVTGSNTTVVATSAAHVLSDKNEEDM